MRQLVFASLLGLVSLMNVHSQTAEDIAGLWDKEHVSNILPSNVRHADLKKYLDQLKKLGINVRQVGLSNANREIYQAEWGTGPLKIMMWSQMHGDEPTATSALIDMFAFLQKNRDKDWVKKIGEKITIRAVPMLNPDGAELFVRRNLQGIDINRDAIDLRTPEARILKQLRDEWNPAIGFNLHNQQSLTTVGRTTQQAAISLLVVYGDAAKTTSYGLERNTRVAAAMATALQKFIPGHIGRYGDEWAPTAFGDNFSAWGTPVILVETGGLHGKDEMFLAKMNFVAFITALNSLATGSEQTQNTAAYLSLPANTSGGLHHVIFRNANVVGSVPFVTDIAINTDRRRAAFPSPGYVRGIGNLVDRRGLTEYDASAFYVVPRFGINLRTGQLAEFLFYRRDRVVDFTVVDLETKFPPDAVFSTGRWIKGENSFAAK